MFLISEIFQKYFFGSQIIASSIYKRDILADNVPAFPKIIVT